MNSREAVEWSIRTLAEAYVSGDIELRTSKQSAMPIGGVSPILGYFDFVEGLAMLSVPRTFKFLQDRRQGALGGLGLSSRAWVQEMRNRGAIRQLSPERTGITVQVHYHQSGGGTKPENFVAMPIGLLTGDTLVATEQSLAPVKQVPPNALDGLPEGHPLAVLNEGGEVNTATIRSPSLISCVVSMTPSMAQFMLGYVYPRQRNARKDWVLMLRADMNAGKWSPGLAPFQWDPDGYVFNGIHRLTALAGANPDLVLSGEEHVINWDPRAKEKVDVTRARTMNDVARFIESDRFLQMPGPARTGIWMHELGLNRNYFTSVPMDERIRMIEECPFYDEVLSMAKYRTVRTYAGVILAAIKAMEVERQKGHEFFRNVVHNVHMMNDQPCPQIQLYADWLINTRSKSVKAPVGNNAFQLGVAIRGIHVWNAYREGREIARISFKPRSDLPEAK